MRVVVAPDKFAGTLSAVQAAEAIATGWRQAASDALVDVVPLSDGGPGFVDVLHDSLGGDVVAVDTVDPLLRPVRAELLVVGDTAYVESAQACGLHLLSADERDPRRATTSGVADLLHAALRQDVVRVVVGLGGSGTNDGGGGLLAGMGVLLLDAEGVALGPGGSRLALLDRVAVARGWSPPSVEIVAATDVDNPLLGEHGASAVFGPQKGASAEDVAVLDAALTRLAAVVDRDLPERAGRAAWPGAGAAGGLGYALFVLGAARRSGIEVVLDAVDLAGRLAGADLVVTGEGSYDAQSARGKVVAGVAALASSAGVPCLVLAGQVDAGGAVPGVAAAHSLAAHAGSVEAAMRDPAAQLTALAAAVAAGRS